MTDKKDPACDGSFSREGRLTTTPQLQPLQHHHTHQQRERSISLSTRNTQHSQLPRDREWKTVKVLLHKILVQEKLESSLSCEILINSCLPVQQNGAPQTPRAQKGVDFVFEMLQMRPRHYTFGCPFQGHDR